MLGKRPRPSMRRTTSMTQLGSGTGVEKSPINEYHPREKQRTPFSITPHLRAPSPGSVHNSNGFNLPNLKTHPFDAMSVNARYSSGVVKDNQPHGDALPKGTGLSLGLGLGIGVTPELASSSPIQPFVASHGQGQGQFTSMYAPNHVGMQGYPMGRVGGIRESYLARSETFPPVDSTSRGYGVEMIEPARFLQACFLCKRRLGHGHDIYMYRDDRAFCSAECRQQQIVVDERKEKYSVRVMATGSVSSNQHQNFGNKNVQSGTAKNVQSERGAAG